MINEKFIDKLLSGRYFQTVALTGTYCLTMIFLAACVIMDKCKLEVFLAAFTGFGTMVALVNEWYFKRDDRQKEGETK